MGKYKLFELEQNFEQEIYGKILLPPQELRRETAHPLFGGIFRGRGLPACKVKQYARSFCAWSK